MKIDLSPLIQYAKTEHLRCLIEVYKDGLTILYCDKSRKREFLKQIRVNKIRKRIKICTYGYDIQFEEEPKITELDYIRGKVIKYFRKDRVIYKGCNGVVFVDFPEEERFYFIKNCFSYSSVNELKEIFTRYNVPATINRDKDTFIIYYEDGS